MIFDVPFTICTVDINLFISDKIFQEIITEEILAEKGPCSKLPSD